MFMQGAFCWRTTNLGAHFLQSSHKFIQGSGLRSIGKDLGYEAQQRDKYKPHLQHETKHVFKIRVQFIYSVMHCFVYIEKTKLCEYLICVNMLVWTFIRHFQDCL